MRVQGSATPAWSAAIILSILSHPRQLSSSAAHWGVKPVVCRTNWMKFHLQNFRRFPEQDRSSNLSGERYSAPAPTPHSALSFYLPGEPSRCGEEYAGILSHSKLFTDFAWIGLRASRLWRMFSGFLWATRNYFYEPAIRLWPQLEAGRQRWQVQLKSWTSTPCPSN